MAKIEIRVPNTQQKWTFATTRFKSSDIWWLACANMANRASNSPILRTESAVEFRSSWRNPTESYGSRRSDIRLSTNQFVESRTIQIFNFCILLREVKRIIENTLRFNTTHLAKPECQPAFILRIPGYIIFYAGRVLTKNISLIS